MTKAQELGITKFPYEEKDERGMTSYREYASGFWAKYENNHPTKFSYEFSNGKSLVIEFFKDHYKTTDHKGVVEFRKHNPIGPDIKIIK